MSCTIDVDKVDFLSKYNILFKCEVSNDFAGEEKGERGNEENHTKMSLNSSQDRTRHFANQ